MVSCGYVKIICLSPVSSTLVPKAEVSYFRENRKRSVMWLLQCFRAGWRSLKGALILLLENICDPILNTYGLYEGYAWKNGEQGTGTLTGLMNFISKIRMLEANCYAVWKSRIYKKWENNEDRRTVELNNVDDKMSKVAQCEDPAIARAFTRMIDHQGKETLWQ